MSTVSLEHAKPSRAATVVNWLQDIPAGVDSMDASSLFQRYQDLQRYVGWTQSDGQRVQSLASCVALEFPSLVEDFYAEIERHPGARQVITGGRAQVERLKGTLTNWLQELFSGRYDQDYVGRRWQVGRRHVEIGLDQVYTNAALSRLRSGLTRAAQQHWEGSAESLTAPLHSLNKLLDLDLAIIEDAYQTEYRMRQQRADRLAAIGQVAGGVAHELRNPLNVIKTSIYYLVNARNPSPEKTAEHLQRIERQVSLSDDVITALSDFAKLPLPEFRPVTIEACLQRALEASALPGSIQVEIDCPDTLPHVLGDGRQLGIVLANLIRNARDAMPSGGRLSLVARQVEDRVAIDVIDTGTGIPRENLDRIHEPLYSTKARGLGLGLAITRAIVEKHHGQLQVASEAGHGSRFTVLLEAAPGRSAQDA
jgi:signal transduction histidine kinase